MRRIVNVLLLVLLPFQAAALWGGIDEDLLAYCRIHHSLQDASSRTLSVLMDSLPIRNRSCEGLVKVRKVERLNLDGKSLIDGTALQFFTDLEELSLRDNAIRDLKPIAKLKKLTFLDLTNNDIYDLSPLRNLSQLRVLKAQRNKFFDSSVLDHLKLEAIYLNQDQVCEQERQWALKEGLIDTTELRSHRNNNFGPIYRVPGERSSGILRFLFCGAVASSF
jgi:hypothetical protein